MIVSVTGDAGSRHLAAAAGGDAEAFEDLIEPLLEAAYRLGLAMLGSDADAQDVVQEATIRAWRRIGHVRDAEKLRPWFLTIVANQCRTLRRRPWRHAIPLQPESYPSARSEWRGSALRQAIGELSAPDRAALFLYFYLDMTVEEVGRVLRVRPAAAKARIYRAAKRLEPGLDAEEIMR